MARIAFFHNALGMTDGVSLEIDKWRHCLERMGHTVFYCAGNDDVPGIHCIPELSFYHPEAYKILKNATFELKDFTEESLEYAIHKLAVMIENKLLDFIKNKNIDVLMPNNLLSVGYHLPALVALSKVIRDTGLPAIVHNHDFYFEHTVETRPTCPAVSRLLETLAPPAFSNVQNIVINRIAQKALKDRKSINAEVVPNVFDFDQPLWGKDDFNADFRATLGLSDNDIVFLQATRVLLRKGIELAIDLVGEIRKPEGRAALESKPLYDGRMFGASDKIVLLCVGHVEEFGGAADYTDRLKIRAAAQGVDLRFAGGRVGQSRLLTADVKRYSLWDAYCFADMVTYPSWREGWGNQFIEAVFAGLPIALFEYPVFASDLRPDGFNVISLGDKLMGKDALDLVMVEPSIIKAAAQQALRLLQDSKLRENQTKTNRAIAKKKYSYRALTSILKRLLEDAGIYPG